MLFVLWFVVLVLLTSACQDRTPPNCVVQMDNAQTFSYTFQVQNSDSVTQSEARIAAAREGDFTFIRIEDSASYQTAINIRTSAPLVAGDGFYYNSSGSYPPDYEPTIEIFGDAPSGSPAIYVGNVIINDVSETYFSVTLDLLVLLDETALVLKGVFDNVKFQPCVE